MSVAREQAEKVSVANRISALLRRHALLIGILAVGLAIRLWGIAYGLPYEGITYNDLTQEEVMEVHRALKLGVGEYVLEFGKGGIYLILFVEFGIYYVISLMMGWVTDSREFALRVLEDRTTLYLIGRVTVAVMGVLTCLVAYAVGRRLYDRRTGVIAACIGALAYFHVQFSSVINVDIGMVLAMWTSVLLYLVFEQHHGTRWLVASGALAGIAIAFKLPGGIVVPLICAAIVTAPTGERQARDIVRQLAVFSVALVGSLTVVAPEWLLWVGELVADVLPVAQAGAGSAGSAADLDDEIRSITTRRLGVSFRYLEHLVSDYNIALTVAAGLAFVVGVRRRARWEILLGGVVIVYVAGMSSSDWTQPERYLLPVFPAFWLLGARFLAQISERRPALLWVGLVVVLALPVFNIARAASEKAGNDTRLLAKHWIEQNIPAGSKVLMDGMQIRNSVSPPLNPDAATIQRQVTTATSKIERNRNVARGLSERTLRLYVEAQSRLPEPRYDLHSTTYGLRVQPLDYYVSNCFDYVVTSSYITRKFSEGARGREMYPDSASFYEQISEDSRIEMVHRETPAPWRSSGPIITVYRVDHHCTADRANGDDA